MLERRHEMGKPHENLPLSSSLSFAISTTRVTINSPASSLGTGVSILSSRVTFKTTNFILALVMPWDGAECKWNTHALQSIAHQDQIQLREMTRSRHLLYSQSLLRVHEWLLALPFRPYRWALPPDGKAENYSGKQECVTCRELCEKIENENEMRKNLNLNSLITYYKAVDRRSILLDDNSGFWEGIRLRS